MDRGELWNKKALSPLIATILLIAFAVSLGTMIMSWSIDAGHEEETADVCSQTAIELQKTASGNAICYDAQGQRVRFLLKNTGQSTVNSFVLRVIDETQDIQEQTVQADLLSGGLGNFEIAYSSASPNKLVASITPVIGQTACPQHEIEQLNIPLC